MNIFLRWGSYIKRQKTLLVKILLLWIVVFSGEVFAQSPTPKKWLVYTDQKYHFSIEYPSDWVVESRVGSSGVGEVLTFRNLVSGGYTIVIGKHDLYKVRPDENISGWTDRQLEREEIVFSSEEVTYFIRQDLKIDGMDAIFIRGVSPLTEFQYTNIQKDKIVWFIWTNMGETTDKRLLRIYEKMRNSFSFPGSTSPPITFPATGAELPNHSGDWMLVFSIALLCTGWRILRKSPDVGR